MIRPLGEQIIIKALQPDSVGSIIIPDSAKRITSTGENKLADQLNFVEAEVIAVGPGKRSKDFDLYDQIVHALSRWMHKCEITDSVEPPYPHLYAETAVLLNRWRDSEKRIPLDVKPGDRILYHPAVQRFDREIAPELIGETEGRFFIIRKESVLAVIDGD